jgi:hypothetical protein
MSEEKTFPSKNTTKSHILFLITSTINPCQAGLSYTSVRSVFTWKHRLDQTIQTVQSIHARMSNEVGHTYKILCVDNSETLDKHVRTSLLANGCDGFEHCHVSAANSQYKALGESSNTVSAIKYLDAMSVFPFDFVFKLSGRYQIHTTFPLKFFLNPDKMVFHSRDNTVTTVLYCIPKSLLKEWKQIVHTIAAGKSGAGSTSGYETQMLYETKPYVVYHTGPLGAEGLVSVDGSLWKI